MIFIKILKKTIQIKNAKILITFDDMIADMLINEKFNPIVTELFIIDRKLNIMKITNKRQFQQIALYIRFCYTSAL